MDLSNLKQLGLKEKEALVYTELLKKDSCLANKISKDTNILRTSIYDYLEILIQKGFASYSIKSGKKYFKAVNPKKLLQNFEERRLREKGILEQVIPSLLAIQNTNDKKTVIEVFEGKEGMKTGMSRILDSKPKELIIYGSSGIGYNLLPYFLIHWHNKRIKKKIPMRIIYNNKEYAQARIKEGPSLKLSKIKYFYEKTISLTGTIIYNNSILLTIWNEVHPIAISIESEEISKSYKDNFEILWKNAKN